MCTRAAALRIFQGDASVFTLSLHGRRRFSVPQGDSDLDVPLPDGCSDAQYLDALERMPVLERHFGPGLVLLYLAGADPHMRATGWGATALSYDGLEASATAGVRLGLAAAGCAGVSIGGRMGMTLPPLRAQLNTWRVALPIPLPLAECCAMSANPFLCRARKRAPAPYRSRESPAFRSISTRWADNDVYGHVTMSCATAGSTLP